MRRVLALAAALLFAACHSAPERSRSERTENEFDAREPLREAEVILPTFPAEADLVEFEVGPAGSHHYFVDEKSIVVGADDIVRYSVVVRASGGAVNVLYEGLRCATAEKRIYAVGRADGKWVKSRRSEWEEIRIGVPNEYQAALFRDVFCIGRGMVRSRAEALSRLKSGERARDAIRP